MINNLENKIQSEVNAIPLSIIILTQNEADNILRCLKSVAWCDDIILIDNSSDATITRARKVIPKSHLRVFTKTQQDDFAQLRSFGLDHARHEWVFFLDADEEVTGDLQQEITTAITQNINGFYIKRRDFFLNTWLKHGNTRDIKRLKLGKKSAGCWQRRVHEVWKIEGNVGQLHTPLLHYPHPSIAEFLERINRWTTLDAEEFYEQGARSIWGKIIVFPSGKFIRNYLYKLGFLDGMPGLLMATLMSFHSFLTRAKLYMLQNSTN